MVYYWYLGLKLLIKIISKHIYQLKMHTEYFETQITYLLFDAFRSARVRYF